jgi:hypothetical protein
MPLAAPIIGRVDPAVARGFIRRHHRPSSPRSEPRVGTALLVMTEKFFDKRWIQVDGTAEVISLPDAAEDLVGYEHRIAGGGDVADDEELGRRHAGSNAVLVRIAIERAGPKGFAPDPA